MRNSYNDPNSNNMKLLIMGFITALVVLALWVAAIVVYVSQSQTNIISNNLPATLQLDPNYGPVGSFVTLHGTNWLPNRAIMVYQTALGVSGVMPRPIASGLSDASGQFTLGFIITSQPQEQNAAAWIIGAQTDDGQMATQAIFSLNGSGVEVLPTATLMAVTTSPPPTAEANFTPPPPVIVTAPPTSRPNDPVPLVIAITDINVRRGPSTQTEIVGLLPAEHTAVTIGVSPDRQWWQILFAAAPDGQGWVAADYVSAQNTNNLPIVALPTPVPPTTTPIPPTATTVPATNMPIPTPILISDWRGDYFANMTLSGAPTFSRNDVTIDFNWQDGAPTKKFPRDDFSARWTRGWPFEAGYYRFVITVDDGARLFIDNTLIVDEWRDGGKREIIREVKLSGGEHTLRLEYYEHQGDALIQLRWEKINLPTPIVVDTATPTTDHFPDWRGEYWTNDHLDGQPKIKRNDEEINFNWGKGSPASEIPTNNFSAIWTRNITFKAGIYRFYVSADDGVRVYLDNERVINEWQVNNGNDVYYAETYLEGQHKVKIDYFEDEGEAAIWFKIDRIGQPTATPTNTPIPTATAAPTNTPIPIPTATNTPLPTATNTPTATSTSSRTPIPSSTPTPSMTPTSSPTLVITAEVRPTELPGTPVEEPTNTPMPFTTPTSSPTLINIYPTTLPDGPPIEFEPTNTATPIPVTNLLPTAIISSPLTTTVGAIVPLSGLNSFDKDGSVISYSWNFGGGNLSYGAIVTHVYTVAGSYPVILTVTDNQGATNSTTTFMQVFPLPVAIIYAPSTAMISQTIWFSGTQSYSPNGFLKDWRWNFGNGITGTGAVISHTYVLTGQYSVTLMVTDTLNLSNQITWPLIITTTR